MAKIQEEIIVIKVSRLLRDADPTADAIIDDSAVENLEVVINELAGNDVMVEIVRE